MELSSFTFNGVSCEEFGLKYAPDIRDMYIWKPVKSNIHQQTFDGHHGGYYYGATKQPKDITLRVFFEESKITEGILNRVESFYRVGTTGRLVFGRRPWIYYNATIVNYDDSQLTNTYNGVITIQLRCFYPFGRCDFLNLDPQDEHYDDIVANSNILPNTTTFFPIEYTNLTTLTQLRLLNPGNETADVAIEIAGDVGSGVYIENLTTGQTCKIISMSAAATTSVGKYYVCDSLNGYSYITDGITHEMKPSWHDRGFIQLQPAKVLARELEGQLGMQMDTDEIFISGDGFPDNCAGKYLVFDDNTCYRIAELRTDAPRRVILQNYNPGMDWHWNHIRILETDEIQIRPVDTMSISRLKFTYSPTFM